jgi:HEAT repeat protein
LAADLKGPGPAARARAAAVLGQKSCPDAIAALAATLKDPSPGIVANAAAALRSNLNPETVAAAKAVLPLIAAAKAEAGRTDDTILEINLQGALAAFGADALGALVADLKHPVRDLRFGAAVGLGMMGASAKEALPTIEAALKDEKDGLVLERLAEAAKSIRGK